MKKILVLVMCICVSAVWAQEAEDREEEAENKKKTAEKSEDGKKKTAAQLEEVVVTASRHEEEIMDSPYMAGTIPSDEIETGYMPRTVPELFKEDPAVLVQKTSNGQGSPFMRGFTGFRTLFMIDGIRLNNSVFRDGPNQYWNTVDPYCIEKVEIVKGPGSVLYGSDAVGGTVNALTKSPLMGNSGFTHTERVYAKYASADDSMVMRAEGDGAVDEYFGFYAGLSVKDFNDLSGGREVGLQPKTGYDEIDYDIKLEYVLKNDAVLTFAHQDVAVIDAWRTHKTIYGINWEDCTNGSDLERSYDQDRDLTYLKYSQDNLGTFVESMEFCLSYQRQMEEYTRIRSDNRRELSGFDVGTFGVTAQFVSPTDSAGLFTYGLEYYSDAVESYKKNWDSSGVYTGSDIQGPVGDDSTYSISGLYVQDEIALNDMLDLTVGLRYTSASVSADKVEDPDTGLEISLSDDYSGLVGSTRLLVKHTDDINTFYGISQGFRAPNLSDLTRLDTARSNEIETPSPGLTPEYFTTLETGIKGRIRDMTGSATFYYTDIRDMIVRYPTGDIIGTDYEVQKDNVGDGYVQGLELYGDWQFTDEWQLFGAFSIQYGRVETYPTSAPVVEEDYMDRMLPPTGLLGIRWSDTSEKYSVELVAEGADGQTLLSARDAGDTDRIPPGGTPGYLVFHLKGNFRLRDDLTVGLAVENITDEDYRIHGSGVNEPGINFLASAKYTF